MADSFFDLIVISSLNRIIKIINIIIFLIVNLLAPIYYNTEENQKIVDNSFETFQFVVVAEVTGHTG